MSATINSILYIEVKGGDCLEKYRKKGKSNTGTYFVCSSKEFDKYEKFFHYSNKYILDLKKVRVYQFEFINYFFSLKNEYNGKMCDFNDVIEELLKINQNPSIDLTLRENDTRKFMKFSDNLNYIVKLFRKLLYEDISKIAIEEKGEFFHIYPVVNYELIPNLIEEVEEEFEDEI